MPFPSWLLAAGALLAVPAAAAAPATPPVHNHTRYELQQVLRPAPGPGPAAPEQLGSVAFVQGQAHAMPWSAEPHCQQDISVVFRAADTEVRWEHLNVCAVRTLTLRYDQHTGAVWAELE